MQFYLRINTSNMYDYPVEECTQILRKVLEKVENGSTDGKVFDTNGNKIGEWGFDFPD